MECLCFEDIAMNSFYRVACSLQIAIDFLCRPNCATPYLLSSICEMQRRLQCNTNLAFECSEHAQASHLSLIFAMSWSIVLQPVDRSDPGTRLQLEPSLTEQVHYLMAEVTSASLRENAPRRVPLESTLTSIKVHALPHDNKHQTIDIAATTALEYIHRPLSHTYTFTRHQEYVISSAIP